MPNSIALCHKLVEIQIRYLVLPKNTWKHARICPLFSIALDSHDSAPRRLSCAPNMRRRGPMATPISIKCSSVVIVL
jgi:hypothetical protein